MAAQDIIVKPLLSEQSYEGIQFKKYTFVVKKTANKTEIKLAVEELFGVKVESVNTINVGDRSAHQGQQVDRILRFVVLIGNGGKKNGNQEI